MNLSKLIKQLQDIQRESPDLHTFVVDMLGHDYNIKAIKTVKQKGKAAFVEIEVEQDF